MNEEIFFIQLRDCFSAGYNLPQFCIDNKIKKPLFMMPNAATAQFLWEVHAQFSHDKKIKPTFATIQGNIDSVRFSPGTLFDALEIKNSADVNPENFDKIFILTTQRLNFNSDKIIYLDELRNKFILRTYVEMPFLHFLKNNPGVKLFLTNFPILQLNEYSTERERKIAAEGTGSLTPISDSLKRDLNSKTPYDFLGYSGQDLLDMLNLTDAKTNLDGSTILNDSDNPLVQVKNGRRVVTNQPENFKNHIYILGGCSHYGTGAPFDKTIPSYLQNLLNKNNLPYRVENISQFFTYRYQDMFYNLQNLDLRDGDIIFVFFDNFLSPNLPAFDVSKIFIRPHNYGEVYVDTAHVNELGYKAMAEKYFDFLTQNNFFQNVEFKYPPPRISSLWHSARKFFKFSTKSAA